MRKRRGEERFLGGWEASSIEILILGHEKAWSLCREKIGVDVREDEALRCGMVVTRIEG